MSHQTRFMALALALSRLARKAGTPRRSRRVGHRGPRRCVNGGKIAAVRVAPQHVDTAMSGRPDS